MINQLSCKLRPENWNFINQVLIHLKFYKGSWPGIQETVLQGHGCSVYSIAVTNDQGEFKNDKKEGKVIEKYADGDVYEGEFKNV